MEDKRRLRERMRRVRRRHVESLPLATRALLFRRPPGPIATMIPERSTVGLYRATAFEAPTGGYAQWFARHGRRIALPWFAGRDEPMSFRLWDDALAGAGLVEGPHGAQPDAGAPLVAPGCVFAPLLAFTREGRRLGQGGGHYDRWLGDHPACTAFGLAWDCQLVESLPEEPHDIPLAAVITPSRVWRADA